jgi:cytoskeletal protein RodZ
MNGETKSKLLLMLIVGVVAIACGTIVSAFVHIDLPQENIIEEIENDTILSINDSNSSINNTTQTTTKKTKTTNKKYKKSYSNSSSSSKNTSSDSGTKPSEKTGTKTSPSENNNVT